MNTNWLHLRVVRSLEVEAPLMRNKLISELPQDPLRLGETVDGGRKVVGGSAKGRTPPGPKLIGELVPGGETLLISISCLRSLRRTE